MRLDLALCRLRFVKTRALARRLAESGHVRVNGERVLRAARDITVGDVITVPQGRAVRVARIVQLPDRRGPPAEAQACYRLLEETISLTARPKAP